MSASIDKSKLQPLILRFEVGVIIEKDNIGYIAYCPALKGLVAEGETEEEVKNNFTNSFISYINSAIKHKDPLPICSAFKVTTGVKPVIENIDVPIDIYNHNILATA
ncbi:MAG: hypothetical protein M1409_04375 [Actinobacteria bacterium]|nr:hypothetical protein [Actinomycetota bacterium]